MFVNQTILKEKQLIHTKHETKERVTVCKSIELLNQMKSLGAELVKQFDYLQKELKRCERIRQDILHKIENSDDLNAPNSYNYTKALKVISQYRRKIKNELSAIEPHMNTIGKHYTMAGSTLGTVQKSYKELSNKTGADYKARELNLDDNILAQVKDYCGVE